MPFQFILCSFIAFDRRCNIFLSGDDDSAAAVAFVTHVDDKVGTLYEALVNAPGCGYLLHQFHRRT